MMLITPDCEVVWSEWSVGGSRLCVHGKHTGCSWQNTEADGSQRETYQCVEWHPEIIMSNQSGAGSTDQLRLMAPDCCLTALNKWGEEKRATEQQNHSVFSISHPQREKFPLCFGFNVRHCMRARSCVLLYKTVRLYSAVCVCVKVRRDVRKNQREGKWEKEFLTNGFFFQCC